MIAELDALLRQGWVLGWNERYFLTLGDMGFHDDTLAGVIEQARGFYA